jgi:hypothetical protein
MTDLPPTRFRLELLLDTRPPRAVMSDITTGDPIGSTEIELGAAPYRLGMTFTAATPTGPLQPQLSSLQSVPPPPPPPFDPALAGDDGVLSLAWELRDRGIDTQDETVLVVALKNRSYYYEVADLEIHLDLAPADGSALEPRPDGSALISIWPDPQWARRIEPQLSQQFEYIVVTRGPRAGLYQLSVEVRYQLFYVQRELVRDTRAIAHLPLHIHGGSGEPVTGNIISPHSSSRFEQITIAQRKLHMTDLIENEAEYGHSRRRELHPIEHKVPLPGGGEICVAYRLVKGSHTRPDDSRCSYGYNPRTKETESYFSTSDEAALELKLVNDSSFDLRHVNITDVHLFAATDSGGMGLPADTEKLPDGNHLFEVLPGEVYFGHLDPKQVQTRYLGLVTRGVKPGRFLVRFEVHYEIVDGVAWVSLPLLVNPD